MNYLLIYLNKIFNVKKGHERSINLKKNIYASLVLKGVSILITLIIVPITLKYLNSTKYGIWLTLSSIVSWLSFFDIGLGNGLKNKFATAIALGEHENARKYVSTGYFTITIIAIIIFILYVIASPFINWSKILNCDSADERELKLLALIVICNFCTQLVFQLIGTLLSAYQKQAASNFLNVLGNGFSLIGIYIVVNYSSIKGSLILIGFIYSFFPVLVYVIANIYLFKTIFKLYKPSYKYFETNFVKDILSLGIKFFLIQLAGLIIFQTNNFLISYLLNPGAVTNYNIVNRLFNTVVMGMSIIMQPFYSAYTEAYAKGDLKWIRNIVMKFSLFIIPLIISLFLIIYFRNSLLKFWLKTDLKIEYSLFLSTAILSFIMIWNNMWGFIIGAIGKLRLGTYTSIFSAIINIPISYILVKNYHYGVTGIIIGTIMSLIISFIVTPIQVYYFIFVKTKNKILNAILS